MTPPVTLNPSAPIVLVLVVVLVLGLCNCAKVLGSFLRSRVFSPCRPFLSSNDQRPRTRTTTRTRTIIAELCRQLGG
jgi:hypothetical protein